ncbi:MAG: PilZ domain-containing protein [Nitrospirae bacterium]|nr:PilZ domain-containing protein [Nitrospirota bacterium]MCL5238179.1 PilZ domain-containing protein [Nitrospirota bacterium]
MKDPNRDKRQHERAPLAEVVTFSVVGSFDGLREFWPEPDRVGTLVDISENGIGLMTDTLLEPGMLLEFNRNSNIKPCVVMWALDAGSKYKVGLKYI